MLLVRHILDLQCEAAVANFEFLRWDAPDSLATVQAHTSLPLPLPLTLILTIPNRAGPCEWCDQAQQGHWGRVL